MKLEDKLKLYIEKEPRARERRNKVRAIANFMKQNHPAIENLSTELLTSFVDEIVALERYWRKILLENPNLRGADYDTKQKVVQEKQIKLGYQGGYHTKFKI